MEVSGMHLANDDSESKRVPFTEFSLVFGTSCAAPVVASILTLINDARLAVGKRPIGMFSFYDYTGDSERGTPQVLLIRR